MAEHVTLKRHKMVAKDDATGTMVEFGEMLPIGESGTMYPKSYASIPQKGGWYVKNKETGEIVSTNPVIGLESYDGMDAAQRSRSIVKPASCPVCQAYFQNAAFLEMHTAKEHGSSSEALHEQRAEQEEQALQVALAETLAESAPKRRGRPPKSVTGESARPL